MPSAALELIAAQRQDETKDWTTFTNEGLDDVHGSAAGYASTRENHVPSTCSTRQKSRDAAQGGGGYAYAGGGMC